MKNTVLIVLSIAGLAGACFGDDQPAGNDRTQFLVSPLIGQNTTELEMPSMAPGMPAISIEDSDTEYGLYVMMMHPRIVINNMYFRTEPFGYEVLGDMFFADVYGPPEEDITWNLGTGYLWHRIETPMADIKVDMPMVKAGLLLRHRRSNITVNPYLAYCWESTGVGATDSDTESVLYGISIKWRWRMVSTTAKYYLEDNLDTGEQHDVFRCLVSAFVTRRWGAVARYDYMENSVTTDSSFLLGPALMF